MPDTPWWEDTEEGTPLLLAFVQVVHAPAEGEALPQQARYRAGVEYVADKLGAAQPLHWRGNDVLLLVQGDTSHAVITTALSAAEAIRERALVDLAMTVQIAVHAARVEWIPDLEKQAPQDVARCEQLARATPAQGLAITEDVYLALTEAERQRFAPLGMLVRDGPAAYVFPASLAPHASPGTFQPQTDAVHWSAFQRYVDSPEIRRLRYVGFPLQKKQPPSLDIREVFIPPEARRLANTTPDWVQAVMGLPQGQAAWTKEGVPSPSVSLAKLVREHRALIVLGDPGSGKTTALRWLAVLAAAGPLSWAEQVGTSERLLPLVISVGRLAQLRARLGADTSVTQTLAVYFQDRSVGDAAQLGPFLERTFAEGEGLLLLDGLDEVRSEERGGILDWLEAFCAHYPSNRFVVSARRVGYSGFALPQGVEVELDTFQDEQIHRYVRAFERACRQWENQGTPDDAGAEQDSARLLEALFASPRLRELARNPFLLSALALIHRAEGRLPRHRVQAYEIFSRTLCETWGQARRVVASETATRDLRYEEEAIPILGQLALRMHLEWPTGVAPEAFVLQTLSQAIQEHSGTSASDGDRSAREFLERAGRDVQILLERGAGQWGFLHLTFQEFFTAVGLLSEERFESVAFEHLFDPRWEEVLRLGVGYMALIQKRAQATQRFVRQVLVHEETGPREYLTSLLKKQVYLAALLASEAGDMLPPSSQKEVARAVADWNQSQPETVAVPFLQELALTEFADRLLDEVLVRVSAQDDSVQGKALLALGSLRTDRALAALRVAANSDHPEVRRQAAYSIVLGGAPMDWETLSLLLSDEEEKVRHTVLVGFLVSRRHHKLDAALDLVLDDARPVTLRLILALLPILMRPESTEMPRDKVHTVSRRLVRKALHKGLSHDDTTVRASALILLSAEHEHFPEEVRAHASALDQVHELRRVHAPNAPTFQARLQSETGALAHVIEASQDPDPRIRAEALSSLAALEDIPMSAIEPLVLRALQDADERVRGIAQGPLLKWEPTEAAIPALLEITRTSPYPETRDAALSALWKLAARG